MNDDRGVDDTGRLTDERYRDLTPSGDDSSGVDTRDPRAGVSLTQIALGSPGPILAYALPAAVGVMLGALGAFLTTSLDDYLIIGGALIPRSSLSPWVALWWVGALIGHGIGTVAATRQTAMRAAGVDESVLHSIAKAVRRPVAVAFAAVLPVVILAVTLATLLLLNAMVFLGGLVVVAIVFVILWSIPLLAGWPILVMRDRALRAAARTGWRELQDSYGRGLSLRWPVAAFLIGGIAVNAAVTRLVGDPVETRWGSTIVTADRTIVLALVTVLIVAAASRRALQRSGELTATVPAARAGLLSAMAAVLALVAPAVGEAAFLAAHPREIVDISAATTSAANSDYQAAPLSGGRAFVVGADIFAGSTAWACAPNECTHSQDLDFVTWATAPRGDGSAVLAGIVPSTDGFAVRVLTVDPRADVMGDDEPLLRDRDAATVLELPNLEDRSTVLTSGDVLGTRIAVSAAGRAPVVATVMNDYARSARHRTEAGSPQRLYVSLCADAPCSAARTVEFDRGDRLVGDGSVVSVVGTASGDAVVAIGSLDPSLPGLEILHVRANGESTTTVVDDADTAVADRDLALAGSALRLGSDGLPRLLHRAEGSTDLVYVTCHDLACADRDSTVIPTDDALGAEPRFVLTAGDRPLIPILAAPDRLDLLSCDDASCTDVSRSAFIEGRSPKRWSQGPSSLAVELSPDARPVIVTEITPNGVGERSNNLTVVTCRDERCGAK